MKWLLEWKFRNDHEWYRFFPSEEEAKIFVVQCEFAKDPNMVTWKLTQIEELEWICCAG